MAARETRSAKPAEATAPEPLPQQPRMPEPDLQLDPPAEKIARLRTFRLGDIDTLLDTVALHTSDAVRLIDLDGRVLGWNRACELLYGWKAHEVLGKRLPHVPAEDRLRALCNIRVVAASGEVGVRETIAQRADGSRFAIRMTVIPVVDDEGNTAGVISLTREASADTRMEHERERFVEIISRQARDPMTAILGYAQLLGHSEISRDDARRDRTLQALTDAAEHVSRLLDDLMLVFDFEHGRLALETAPVDLGELVTHVVERAETYGVDVLVDFDPNLGEIVADGRRIRQAVACLLDNAVRHTPPGGTVGLSVFAAGDEAVVEVIDHGPGIALADQPLIFDRFYSAASPGGEQAGVGMGLYLVRVIVDAHGGAVNVVSTPGVGSTFALRLPRIAQPSGEAFQ